VITSNQQTILTEVLEGYPKVSNSNQAKQMHIKSLTAVLILGIIAVTEAAGVACGCQQGKGGLSQIYACGSQAFKDFLKRPFKLSDIKFDSRKQQCSVMMIGGNSVGQKRIGYLACPFTDDSNACCCANPKATAYSAAVKEAGFSDKMIAAAGFPGNNNPAR